MGSHMEVLISGTFIFFWNNVSQPLDFGDHLQGTMVQILVGLGLNQPFGPGPNPTHNPLFHFKPKSSVTST